MVDVRWTLQASADLDSIVGFISKDSPQYARLFVVDVFQAVGRIAGLPKSGRVVPELNEASVREVIPGNCRVVCRLKQGFVELLTTYHGARLLDPGKLK